MNAATQYPPPLMIVPEFILQTTIQNLLDGVRNDWAANQADTTKSYLYRMLEGTSFQRYDFFVQAQKIICGKKDDPRRLEVDLMFNMKRNGPPTIHITLPAESASTNGNGLGTDEGYEDPILDTEGDQDTHTPTEVLPVFTRRYRASYNVVVTSDNSNEVIFVYHFVRALLTAAIFHLNASGISNVSLGGNDVRPYTPELANQLYMRALIVNIEYDTHVPSLNLAFIPNDIIVIGTPENDISPYGIYGDEGLGESNL